MKISVLTPTYNREKLLPQLYKSLIKNIKCGIDIEWLIMDDGSTDNTESVINKFINEDKFTIKYFKQANQGKMTAINNLIGYSTGELILVCDSDDYFTPKAFRTIKEEYEKNKDRKDIYGLCFLKYNSKNENMGNEFKNKETTMFDLYFKEGENGEKAVVFFSNIRKKYKHKLEHNEKFVTEARMFHEMDDMYKMMCVNEPIMICEYQEAGYSKNIIKEFTENPFGYYEYFKEILQKDMKGVLFHKRIYAIKHFILFSYLTKSKNSKKYIKNLINKVIYIVMYIPGIVKTKIQFKV